MWCPSAFLREFPHDRSAVGHIRPRPTLVEIGLAVLRLRESVLAVLDPYAVADAFQRALLATTTSDSRRPFRPTVDARYVAQQTAEELPFSRYGPPPAHNCEDHITGEVWRNRDSRGGGADRSAQEMWRRCRTVSPLCRRPVRPAAANGFCPWRSGCEGGNGGHGMSPFRVSGPAGQ